MVRGRAVLELPVPRVPVAVAVEEPPVAVAVEEPSALLGLVRQTCTSAAAATSTQTWLGSQVLPPAHAEPALTGTQKPPRQLPDWQSLLAEQVTVRAPVPRPVQTLDRQRALLPQSVWLSQPRPRVGITLALGRTELRIEFGIALETTEASSEAALSAGVAIGPAAEVRVETAPETMLAMVLTGTSPSLRAELAMEPIALTAELTGEMTGVAADVTWERALPTADSTPPSCRFSTCRGRTRAASEKVAKTARAQKAAEILVMAGRILDEVNEEGMWNN